jgi:hypothetical protein
MRITSLILSIAAAVLIPLSGHAAEQLSDLTGPWQLFVDDYLIDGQENATRVYHAFDKHPKNPIMEATKPWEGTLAYIYGTVLPGEDGTGYRMWYHSWNDGVYRMLYASSKDGMNWEKPALGLTEWKGSKENNILFQRTHENHAPQVIYTPWEKDPQRRYKMLYYEYGRTPPDWTESGYYGAYSPDGIRWTDTGDSPVLLDPGDVGNFVWDPHQKRYIGWPKKFTEVRGFRRRCVGVSATTDFESWPESKMAFVPDKFDDRWLHAEGASYPKDAHTDFYGLSAFPYESMYIGFLWVFPITNGKSDGPIFIELVTSRDGFEWRRQDEPRPPVLPCGPEGSWDDGMLFTPNHPLVEGDKIKLFYGGFDVTHGVDGAIGSVGIATLRKDGFASLDAAAKEAAVTTPPLTGAQGPLRVNYAAQGGWLRVEVLDADGKAVPGYGRADCKALTGDAVNAKVSWKKHDALPKDTAPLHLRFVFKNTSLYSFAAGDTLQRQE